MFVLPFQEWRKHNNNGTAPHRYKGEWAISKAHKHYFYITEL